MSLQKYNLMAENYDYTHLMVNHIKIHRDLMTAQVMANAAWLGYYLTKHEKWPPPPKLIGGLLLSGSMVWFFYHILGAIGVENGYRIAGCMIAGAAGAPMFKIVTIKGVQIIEAVMDKFLNKFKGV